MPLHSAVLLFWCEVFCLYFVPAQAQLRRFHCSRRCGAGAGAAAPVAAGAGAAAAPVAAGASLAVVRTRWLR